MSPLIREKSVSRSCACSGRSAGMTIGPANNGVGVAVDSSGAALCASATG
jgi:hypothetical protein